MRWGAKKATLLAVALGGSMVASAASVTAVAADVTLLASSAINVVLEELVPRFEKETGNKVSMRLDFGALLKKEIEAGAAFDAAILVGRIDDLVQQGKVVPGTPVALGRSGYGVAVRVGAPKPDITTAEAFKATMLKAASVGYAKDGGSGAYFLQLLGRLDIADAMKPKLRPSASSQEDVASGAVEMTVNGIVPILRAGGIELVGPLPAGLQSHSVFFAGVSTASLQPEAARALLAFLASPTARAVFAKRGVEPAQ